MQAVDSKWISDNNNNNIHVMILLELWELE